MLVLDGFHGHAAEETRVLESINIDQFSMPEVLTLLQMLVGCIS
jgi:hypothetical protein